MHGGDGVVAAADEVDPRQQTSSRAEVQEAEECGRALPNEAPKVGSRAVSSMASMEATPSARRTSTSHSAVSAEKRASPWMRRSPRMYTALTRLKPRDVRVEMCRLCMSRLTTRALKKCRRCRTEITGEP